MLIYKMEAREASISNANEILCDSNLHAGKVFCALENIIDYRMFSACKTILYFVCTHRSPECKHDQSMT